MKDTPHQEMTGQEGERNNNNNNNLKLARSYLPTYMKGTNDNVSTYIYRKYVSNEKTAKEGQRKGRGSG